jgi:hypothetical protein
MRASVAHGRDQFEIFDELGQALEVAPDGEDLLSRRAMVILRSILIDFLASTVAAALTSSPGARCGGCSFGSAVLTPSAPYT